MKRWLTWLLSAALLSICGCTNQAGETGVTTNPPPQSTRNMRQLNLSVSKDDGMMRIERPSLGDRVPMGEPDTWTVFVYLCGSNLESNWSCASNDMYEILDGTYSNNVRFVIETGGSNIWHFVEDNTIPADRNQRFVIQNGGVYRMWDGEHAPMGDSRTLASFLKWGVENYASEHMAVILWDHGGGSVSGVCYDEYENEHHGNYDLLSLTELDAALLSVFQDMTDKFEFIGFDACLMSTIETANIIASYADYMIASPESEPGDGWDYTALANALAASPDSRADEVGRQICDSYYASYANGNSQSLATLSLLDLSNVDTFLTYFNDFSKELYESAQDIGRMSYISRAIQNIDNFGGNSPNEGYTNMVDIGLMIDACSPYVTNSSLARQSLEDLVAYKVMGSSHASTSGLSIFYPLKIGSSEYMDKAAGISISPWYLSFTDIQNNGAIYTDVAYAYYNHSLDNGETWNPGTGEEIETWNSSQGNSYNETDGFYQAQEPSQVYTYTDDDIHWGNSPFITFDEYPQANAEGEYYCRLDEMGRTFIADIKAKCYELNHEEKDFIELGETCQIYGSWEEGYFKDGFDGTWISLPDGQNLAIYVVERRPDGVAYSSPIRLNGERKFLRLNWYYDGRIEAIGIWDGVDETGTASRIQPLPRQGEEIVPIYYAHNAITKEEATYRGTPYIIEENLEIQASYLEAGEYWYNFYITDIFGDWLETEQVNLITDGKGSRPIWAYG